MSLFSSEELARLLKRSIDEGKNKNDIPIDGILENLHERFARYQQWIERGCRFQPGNIVTPIKGGKYRDHGDPHIVLEVKEMLPDPLMSIGEPAMSEFGSRLDVRVLFRSSDDHYPMFWMESVELEPWTPPNQD